MSWPLDATPEARLRTKLRTLPSLRHLCMTCDADDIRAVLDALDNARAALARQRPFAPDSAVAQVARRVWHPDPALDEPL